MSNNHFNGKDLEEIWDQVPADYYQKGISTNLLQRLWHTRKFRAVASLLQKYNPSPKSILDVGSASGWFLDQLHSQFPQSSLTGIDVYDKAIEYGKKKYKYIDFKVADAHKIPFNNNAFDVVICCEVLEHVIDPLQVLVEIKRVLRKKGIAIIEIDSGNFLFKIVWYWWTHLRRGVWRDSHLHPFNVKKLEKLFLKSGFVIKKKKLFNFSMAVAFVLEPS